MKFQIDFSLNPFCTARIRGQRPFSRQLPVLISPVSISTLTFNDLNYIFLYQKSRRVVHNRIYNKLSISTIVSQNTGYLIFGLHFRFRHDVHDFLHGVDRSAEFGNFVPAGTRHARRLLAEHATEYFPVLRLDRRRLQ